MHKISKEVYDLAIDSYFLWKELDQRMKSISSRGVNIHEGITEAIVCYVNDFFHSVGHGSEDAVSISGETIQVKATSNYNSDLTSFGPSSEFEFLHFARLDSKTDELFLYEIPVDELYDVMVNANETFRDQQLQRRRPRLSLINKFIIPMNIEHYCVVDLKTGAFNHI